MKKQVLIYRKPAKELKKGDTILTSRMTVENIDIIHIYSSSVYAETIESTGMRFWPDDDVLVVE